MARRPGIDGRELLIAAALRLFAEQGIDAVSIRAVNREAGLGPATAHYHFGTKDALVQAVLEVHDSQIKDAVTQRTHSMLASGAPITSRDIVQMLAASYLDLVTSQPATGIDWVRVVGKSFQSDHETARAHSPLKAAGRAVARAFPDSTAAQRESALLMCLSLLVTQLVEPRSLGARRGHPSRVDLDLLIAFLSGGLDAALGQEGSATSVESA